MNKRSVRARKKSGLPRDLVLSCARHNLDFDMEMVGRTGNLKTVMKIIHHSASRSSRKSPAHPLPL